MITQPKMSNENIFLFRSDFENHCDQLIEDFQELERHVNAAVLHQVVDVFKETIEPLERLVKAALSPLKVIQHKSHLSLFSRFSYIYAYFLGI